MTYDPSKHLRPHEHPYHAVRVTTVTTRIYNVYGVSSAEEAEAFVALEGDTDKCPVRNVETYETPYDVQVVTPTQAT